MNMELLTKKLFEQWMETILERLERQDEMLLALKAPEKREHTPDRIRLFDNQDLCLLLQVSKRSLQRYRSLGVLPYVMLRHKTYYKESEVLRFIATHCRIFHKEEVERYKARISKLP